MDTVWTFKTKNFRVVLECEEERDPDLSWADGETLDKLARGVWWNLRYYVASTPRTGRAPPPLATYVIGNGDGS